MGGQHFGELAKITGVIIYKLSPFELKAFPNVKQAIRNTIQRMAYTMPIFVPPFITAFLVYNIGEERYRQLQRKNPNDYINDGEDENKNDDCICK